MGIITTNLLNRFWKRGIKPIKESLDGKFDASGVINTIAGEKLMGNLKESFAGFRRHW